MYWDRAFLIAAERERDAESSGIIQPQADAPVCTLTNTECRWRRFNATVIEHIGSNRAAPHNMAKVKQRTLSPRKSQPQLSSAMSAIHFEISRILPGGLARVPRIYNCARGFVLVISDPPRSRMPPANSGPAARPAVPQVAASPFASGTARASRSLGR